MIANRSAPSATIVPTLIYEDVGAAATWLCGAFGFSVRLLTPPDASGMIGHAQLAFGGAAIMLGAARVGQGFNAPDSALFRPPRHGELSHYIHVRVEDVDRHMEHAKAFGARILSTPADQMFGERQYTAEDLAGHRWSFSQTIDDIDPASWGGRLA